MKKVLKYHDVSLKSGVGGVKEDQELYGERNWDDSVEKFIQRLEDIERRSQAAEASPDDLMLATVVAMRDMDLACEVFERLNAKDASSVQEARIRFRHRTDAVISTSYFLNHARTWPNGHPGDYKIIEGVYKNTEMSNGLGFYLDRYFLKVITLAIAVRGRKETLRDLLRRELSTRNEPRILDVACGSCREIFELAVEIERAKAKIICLDIDPDALNYSSNRLAHANLSNDRVEFRKYNAIKMVNPDRNLKEFGSQDMIYSVGLFDYIRDDILVRMLNALYHLLNPGGTLITSFKDSRRYRTFDNRWLLDWDHFFQRTEQDVWNLFEKAGIRAETIMTTREASGVIQFFVAQK